jgi:orotidine-5'-phosphate decarboxylase
MTDINIREHLIVALDLPDADSALAAVSELRGAVDYIKVGKQLFTAEGPELIRKLNDLGFKIFLDLKFHDIPNTVASAGIEAAKLGVEMFNLHVTGGSEMMKTTVGRVKEYCGGAEVKAPLILGVTVLTSLNDEDMKQLGYHDDVKGQVRRFARMAKEAGLDGVVASAKEISLIREECSSGFKIVTPGIRPKWAAVDDQKRVITPRDAISGGADYIVVGRPVMKADDRKKAVNRLLED